MANKEYIKATGKRKSSIARVSIIPGTGKITINKKDINEIYTLDTLKAPQMGIVLITGIIGLLFKPYKQMAQTTQT